MDLLDGACSGRSKFVSFFFCSIKQIVINLYFKILAERIKNFKLQLLLSCTKCNVENNIQKSGTFSTINEYFCIFLPTSIVVLDDLKTQISLTKMTFTSLHTMAC